MIPIPFNGFVVLRPTPANADSSSIGGLALPSRQTRGPGGRMVDAEHIECRGIVAALPGGRDRLLIGDDEVCLGDEVAFAEIDSLLVQLLADRWWVTKVGDVRAIVRRSQPPHLAESGPNL